MRSVIVSILLLSAAFYSAAAQTDEPLNKSKIQGKVYGYKGPLELKISQVPPYPLPTDTNPQTIKTSGDGRFTFRKSLSNPVKLYLWYDTGDNTYVSSFTLEPNTQYFMIVQYGNPVVRLDSIAPYTVDEEKLMRNRTVLLENY